MAIEVTPRSDRSRIFFFQNRYICRVDWSHRSMLLLDHLRSARETGIDITELTDDIAPAEIGVDSIMAIEVTATAL
jgi:hypothetical protein